jgi:hypothetical protein
MAKPRFLETVNRILENYRTPRIYGHSFRTGGASHYLSCGVDPEIVRLDGRWKSTSAGPLHTISKIYRTLYLSQGWGERR